MLCSVFTMLLLILLLLYLIIIAKLTGLDSNFEFQILTAKNLPKIGKRGKSGKNQEKEEKSGRKGKGLSLCPPPHRAGYVTA